MGLSVLQNQKPTRNSETTPFQSSHFRKATRIGLGLVMGLVVLATSSWWIWRTLQEYQQKVPAGPSQLDTNIPLHESHSDEKIQARFSVLHHALNPNESIHQALTSAGFTEVDISWIVQAAKKHTNLSRVRAGMEFTLWREKETFSSLQIELTPAKTLILRPSRDQGWVASLHEIPYETEVATFTGPINTSLWRSGLEAGLDGNLIAEFAEVFAWQLDFSREVRKGDRWRIAVEQKTLGGKPAGWGKILAAEYTNDSDTYTGVWFKSKDGHGSFYAPDGSSLRRMFLRSPVRYSRISSRFQRRRFHPILKKHRPHYGVDYAAASGTNVRTVGDGIVTFAGRKGGSGNFVKVKHNGTFQTSYSHLQRIGKGIRKGTRVSQGRIIGTVGSTGLATGPHLHFAFYENGHYVDPLSRKFPSADPVPSRNKKQFSRVATHALSLLPPWSQGALARVGL